MSYLKDFEDNSPEIKILRKIQRLALENGNAKGQIMWHSTDQKGSQFVRTISADGGKFNCMAVYEKIKINPNGASPFPVSPTGQSAFSSYNFHVTFSDSRFPRDKPSVSGGEEPCFQALAKEFNIN